MLRFGTASQSHRLVVRQIVLLQPGLPLPGHRQIDHTADLALEIWADDEVGLLQEGARAIVEILTEQSRIQGDARRTVELSAIDAEDRLVQWLNEIIVAAVLDGFLSASAEIVLTQDGLRAKVRGEANAAHKIVDELKSATYHDLALTIAPKECRARVVIDV